MRAPSSRLGWGLAALLIAGAAAAQTPPASPSLRASTDAAPAASGSTAAATSTSTTTTPAVAGVPRSATARSAPVAVAGNAATPSLTAPLPSLGLSGGGDPAPLCRARCAPAFYGCVSGGGADGSCHTALGVCRRSCDALNVPVGRLQSPLPAAGLAPAGPLRPLPGGLPGLQ